MTLIPKKDAAPVSSGRIELLLRPHGINEMTAKFLFDVKQPADGLKAELARLGALKVQPTTRARSSFKSEQWFGLRAAELPSPAQRLVTVHFPHTTDLEQAARDLAKQPEVERAVPVPVLVPASDPLLGTSSQIVTDGQGGLENQWYLYRCNVPAAWQHTSGSGVVIADVDFGCRPSHRDLADNIAITWNAVDGSADVTAGDQIFHGTGVIGLAAAIANNDLGMVGVAPKATVWAVQANAANGPPLDGDPWAAAINTVVAQPSNGRRKVLVLEAQTAAGYCIESQLSVWQAVREAVAAGVVVCVAAGNAGVDASIDEQGQPIGESGSILVGATSYDPEVDPLASFSNWGRRVVVCAPGDSDHDVTANSDSDTSYTNPFGGTSGATPKVAGTVALMLAVNPELTPAKVKDILIRTAAQIHASHPLGGGRLDAGAAVAMAAQLAQAARPLSLRQGHLGAQSPFSAVVHQSAVGETALRENTSTTFCLRGPGGVYVERLTLEDVAVLFGFR